MAADLVAGALPPGGGVSGELVEAVAVEEMAGVGGGDRDAVVALFDDDVHGRSSATDGS